MDNTDRGDSRAALTVQERRRLFARMKQLTRYGHHAEAHAIWLQITGMVHQEAA